MFCITVKIHVYLHKSSQRFGVPCAVYKYRGNQREGVGLLEYQGAMPSLRDVAHDGDLCTFSNRSAPDRYKCCGPSGQAAWTVHHVQNHTLLLGHSPQANTHGSVVLGQPSSLRPHRRYP